MKITLYSPTHWRVPDEYFEPQQHELLRLEGPSDALVTQVSEAPPDLLFIHGFAMDERLLSEISRLCRLLPDVAVVPYCDEPDREFLIKLMRVGVREVLLQETSEAVREVLARVGLEMKKAQWDETRHATAIGLISAKGGDGSSMLAANLAVAISLVPNTKVLVIDLSLPFGDLDLYVSATPPTHTLVHFSDEIQRLDASLLASMVHHVSSQLDMVASPKVFDEAFRIEPTHVRKLIDVAIQEYDYVLIDFGSQVGPFVTNVLDALDELVMVATATMPSVRHASQLMRLWGGLDFDVGKVSLVLNRYSDHYNITPEDLARAVGRSVSAIIPGEVLVAEEALLKSEPVVRHDAKSKLAKAIMAWSSRWTGQHEPEVKSLWHRLKIK